MFPGKTVLGYRIRKSATILRGKFHCLGTTILWSVPNSLTSEAQTLETSLWKSHFLVKWMSTRHLNAREKGPLPVVLDVLCLKHIKEEGRCTPKSTGILQGGSLSYFQRNYFWEPRAMTQWWPTWEYLKLCFYAFYVSKHLKYSGSLEEKLWQT